MTGLDLEAIRAPKSSVWFHVPKESLHSGSASIADPPWPSFDVVHRLEYERLLGAVETITRERDEAIEGQRIIAAQRDEQLRVGQLAWDRAQEARAEADTLRAALVEINYQLVLAWNSGDWRHVDSALTAVNAALAGVSAGYVVPQETA